MDRLDENILMRLQQDARVTNRDLARAVGLSEAQCSRRVRDLFARGVVVACVAVLDPAQVGESFDAIVHVILSSSTAEAARRFEDSVVRVAAVVEVERVVGGADYRLRVVAPDTAGFQQVLEEDLAALPGVARLETWVSVRKIKSQFNRTLPQKRVK